MYAFQLKKHGVQVTANLAFPRLKDIDKKKSQSAFTKTQGVQIQKVLG
jgi:hypothetical protein